MDIADIVMIAEDNWAARYERQQAAYERDRKRIYDEFMAALEAPLLAHVSSGQRRYPVVELLFENITADKYRAKAAMAIAILMRDPAGREICEAMALQHADDYAEADDE